MHFRLAALLLTASVFLVNFQHLFAQCTNPINTFPYTENFETNNGSWTSGGTAKTWAWGHPNKPVINSAGTGQKCWITGGLNNGPYGNGERSWLRSPCFNFSTIAHPYVRFKVNWDTESGFDGAGFQYSIDNGTTWLNIGAANEPPSCFGSNWYNDSSINYLTTLATPLHGWSGSIPTPPAPGCAGGRGSNGWVTAAHIIPAIANKPRVLFRFIFGAGTTCNDYDGFAIDDIYIGEAPPISPEFSFTCSGNLRVNFADATQPCAATWSWNFGDPNSGAANTSQVRNPNHIFSAPGVYNVVLTVTQPQSGTFQIQHPVQVLGANVQLDSISCHNGSNGAITLQGQGEPSGNYRYIWAGINVPDTVKQLQSLAAGNYTIQVISGTACPYLLNIQLKNPDSLIVGDTLIQPTCAKPQGEAWLRPSGGHPPYTAVWQPGGATGLHRTDLDWIPYTIAVTDAKNCVTQHTLVVVGDCPDYKLPNVFTPNGDGKNDVFRPFPFGGVESVDFRVYNRWGELVFKTEDPHLNWDGSNQSPGDYFYTITVHYPASTKKPDVNWSGKLSLLP